MATINNPALQPLPLNLEQPEVVEVAPELVEQVIERPSITQLSAAAVRGAVLGPFRQVKEIGGEVKQAADDYRSIKDLLRDKASRASGSLQFSMLKAWYALPMPAYQVADDALTYPLYLHVQEQANTGTAYGVTAAATFALAGAMGLGQRAVEGKKAELVDVPVADDDADQIPLVLDASVNSAPWQVMRRANAPRESGEPIKRSRLRNIAMFAGSYATVNTALYAAAEQLPGNEWAGFGAMLVGVWAVAGSYREVKEQLIPAEQAEQETYEQ